ncbi:CDP-glycerol glycerophosphotransferase family protein [Exiguobacterium sp. SH4S7]|uniref:CDP-glycerol glycerophosphotransferase family protein n=1 Tax=Exiguobacterium sp. SH4S7 TaxID=2510958 RepID=UPI001375C20F|nr:CDP-glycerol glycerophosphotransferase family protein [Exiguobacterium sp. SH4S7]
MAYKFIRKILIDAYSNTLKKVISVRGVKNIIVFESQSDFSDNSKALFLNMIKYNVNKHYKIVWLVDDAKQIKTQKYENVYFFSIKSDGSIINKLVTLAKIEFLLSKTRFYFFTHRNFSISPPTENQVFFNLTHGTPLKNSTGRHSSFKKSTYILTTSKTAGDLRVRTYEGGTEKLKILGFPRNDFLFTEKDSLQKIGVNKKAYNKVVFWLPTFRRHKNAKTNDSRKLEEELDFPIVNNVMQLMKLNQYLEKNKIFLIIKVHPAQDLKYFISGDFSNVKILTNDFIFDSKIELYELLGQSDALLTDYSSVYLDYLLIDKPIGFTIDDLGEYQQELGFMVNNPLDIMPGMKIPDQESLCTFFDNVLLNNDEWREKREKVKKEFNYYTDNQASERIMKDLGFI